MIQFRSNRKPLLWRVPRYRSTATKSEIRWGEILLGALSGTLINFLVALPPTTAETVETPATGETPQENDAVGEVVPNGTRGESYIPSAQSNRAAFRTASATSQPQPTDVANLQFSPLFAPIEPDRVTSTLVESSQPPLQTSSNELQLMPGGDENTAQASPDESGIRAEPSSPVDTTRPRRRIISPVRPPSNSTPNRRIIYPPTTRPSTTRPEPSPALPSRPSPPPLRPLVEEDPAEQVAPAALQVQPSSLPITAMEALAMRQELENLIGRFESALLSANSTTSTRDLLALDSTESIPSASSKENETPSRSAATALAAQQVLESLPQLIARREYATARQQWLEARRSLWENFPTDQPQAQPEVRAMWLDRGTIVRAGSRQGLAQIFDRLAAAGINTVFLETVNAGYPIYASAIAPQQNPLIRGWDPLQEAVDLAHERNMELHAWVWVFAAGNQRHNELLNLPPSYPGPVIAAHPDWANYDNRGSIIPLGQGKPFLDPANPAVRRYSLRLLEEIVNNYDVDGIQLDYIRYPFQDPSANRTYGYGLAARQQFQRLTGVDPISLSPRDSATATPEQRQRQRELWQQWTEFRTEQVNSFVAEVSTLLRRRRPDIVLSAAVFPLSEHERLQKIQQEWEVWARRGDVDLIVPMTYAMDTNRLQRLAQPWLTQADLGSTLVLPGIRLLNLPDTATIDQIQALRDAPAGGYALFAAENLSDNLQNVFRRTQGPRRDDAEEPIPYRQPFSATASRYAALQREWSFLRENNQLWLREPQLQAMGTQAQTLGEALDELADRPSARRLERARSLLTTFRSQFREWMHLQALNQGYRVRTWENRLAMLDTLLRYGERTTLQRPNSTERATNE